MPSIAVENGSTPTEHVPAWKRLGLKLKNAKDTVRDVHVSNSAPAAKTRKVSEENESTLAQARSSSLDKGRPSGVDAPNGALKKSRTKQAQEEGVPKGTSNDSGAATSVTARRSNEINGTTEEHHPLSWRKRKRDVNSPSGTAALVHKSTIQSSTASRPELDTDTRTPAAKRRKSVVFTPDTKAEDGSSARDLFNAWAAQHPEHYDVHARLSEQSKPAAAITKSSMNEEDLSVEKHVKKAKKKKQRQSSDAVAVSASETLGDRKKGPPGYLTYLQQYHSNRKNWKCNKSQQISLLKNLFDLNRIPVEHDEALTSYISGLQGEAAKQRLRSTAQQIVDDEPGTSTLSASSESPQPPGPTASVPDNPTAPNAGPNESLQARSTQGEHEKRPDDSRLRQLKRERAVKVLRALGTEQNTSSSARSNEGTNNRAGSHSHEANGNSTTPDTAFSSGGQVKSTTGQVKKVSRKRKRRTEAPSGGSSSSSSSSSDDDEADHSSKRLTTSTRADEGHADKISTTDQETSSLSSSSSEPSDDPDSESSSS